MYKCIDTFACRLNHLISGLTPQSFHAVNILLHCLVSVAALRVFFHLLNGSHSSALLAALLFATHPIHTEAVAGIVGRADLLCALFVFGALLAYIHAVQTELLASTLYYNNNNVASPSKKYLRDGISSHRNLKLYGRFNSPVDKKEEGSGHYLLVCAVCTTVAMLCKEVGITALGLCSAYDLIVTSCGMPSGGISCFLPFTRHWSMCPRKNYGKLHGLLCSYHLTIMHWLFAFYSLIYFYY